MAIKKYKPNHAGRRKSSVDAFSDITKKKPEKKLTVIKKKTGGRNAQGRITVRHIGGGNKRFIRIVDFKRNIFDVPAEVLAIEYDPNRNARIALVQYEGGEKSYFLAPVNLRVGTRVVSSRNKIDVKVGNRSTIENIPPGVMVYNVELSPGKGGELARSAGNGIMIQSVEGDNAQLKLPSGEIRLVSSKCMATIGQVSNPDYRHIRWGKAGRTRRKGIRPTVRGKAMNPVDHPHGGGEGRAPIGLKRPKTPWGKPALGARTRRKGKKSDKHIIKRRNK
ncbi:50S ribosomal protein L2 [Patescibacteria group bacterium]|nr:50S ribosomal protein L2 [Patescibacteria group bacterium]